MRRYQSSITTREVLECDGPDCRSELLGPWRQGDWEDAQAAVIPLAITAGWCAVRGLEPQVYCPRCEPGRHASLIWGDPR